MCESSSIKMHEMYFKKGFDRIFKMMQMEKFCDLDVVIGSESYPVHSVIMAANSDYFLDFDLNFCNLSRNEVKISGIDNDVMKKIISFCYTGKIDLNGNMVRKIYRAAEILKMQSLLQTCENLLKTAIDINNCCLVAKFGNANSKILAKEFIEFNFNEVCLTEEFLNIEFNLLLDILKSDNLNVTLETTVFSSVKRWVQYDYPKRKDHLHSLYEFIKLPLLPIETLFDELEPLHSGKCSSIVSEAVQWKTIPNRKTKFDSSRNVPRKSAVVALSIGDFHTATTKMVMLYDPETNSMTEFMDLKTETRNFCATILGDEIVIMAGFTGSYQNINEVYSYSIKTGTKKLLPPMLEIRGHPIVAVIDGFIYAFGGANENTELKTVERFDPTTRKWTFATPMMTARRDAAGVLVDSIFYAIGGFNNAKALNNVESYCTTTGEWKQLTPMIEARQTLTVAAAGGFIYALGGWIGSILSTVERYDLQTDTWIKVASMSVARYGLGACVFGEKLIAYGGSNGSDTIADLEEYDPATNKWRTLTSTVKRGHFNFIAVSKGWLKRLKPNSIKNESLYSENQSIA
ncbi:kelch-like protein 1 [Arctopsyche grandis]|uniref:kelch-like protein 1 n=1 Tax=Arctopsyche grandis TaxID=121162 RepID=UPI00406D9763